MRRRRQPAPVTSFPEPVEIVAEEAAYGGESLGHLPDGRVVFVPRLLPQERARVTITEERRDYARGEIDELLVASPDRVPPPCPYFQEGCGGCSWQAATYPAQLAIKRSVVVTQLGRVGHFPDAESLVRPVIGMVAPWHYRNQARFTVGRRYGELCFTYRSTHRLLRVDHCWISHPTINALLETLQGALADSERRIHQVAIRVGANTGQVLVSPDLSDLVSIPSGQQFLGEELLGHRFRMHASSFFQVNTRREMRELPSAIGRSVLPVPPDGVSIAELLALLVLDRLDPRGDEIVVDAYCGVGTFALLMAPCVAQVIGIEEARSAIVDAEVNAAGVQNVRFVHARTEDALPTLDLPRRPDAVVLDPARVGAHPNVLAALLAPGMRPPKLIYVSCDPTTLARDLRILVDGGYMLKEVQPLDMFPQTYHVECVATLRL